MESTEKDREHLDMPAIIEGFQRDLRQASLERARLAEELKESREQSEKLQSTVGSLHTSLDSTLELLEKMIEERDNK